MTAPAGIETFGNQPVATVTTGGTTTSDTSFIVTTTDPWPAASASTVPATFFRFVDQANTSEIMIATATPSPNSGSGLAWTVTRGAEGSTPVAHSAGWTAVQIITAGSLQNLKQATNASTTPVTITTSTTETVLASYLPAPADYEVGASFDIIAYGTVIAHGGSSRGTLAFNVYWGGSGSVGSAFTATGSTLIASLVTGANTPPFAATTVIAGASFDINGTVTIQALSSGTPHTVHANLNTWLSAGSTLSTAPLVGSATDTTSSGGASTAGPITVSTAVGPIILTAKWTANYTVYGLTAVAPLIYRAA